MCGIAGFIDDARKSSAEQLRAEATAMVRTLAHRGPDDEGVWTEAASGVALAHRRLAIVDLSPLGHQPMASACGRYQVTYNGEIYNHAELRRELEQQGHRFRSTCDTEVLLSAVAQWGVVEAARRFNGMFAFAIWDRSERRLTLVRDRLGIKPLYYGRSGNVFLFGSELKALRAHPAVKPDVARDALALFLQHGYVPAPLSIFRGVKKLLPGHVLSVSLDRPAPVEQVFWSMTEVVEAGGQQRQAAVARPEAVERLDELLRDAVRLRMRADVPFGAFLSGGLDSSLIVALMQHQSSQPVKTFTIGTEDARLDEAAHARAVADYLRTDHRQYNVRPADALELVPQLPQLYDEPFADSSQIPTYLVARLAREHVTVGLSGDGGDELLGGYAHYRRMQRIWRRIAWCPRPARAAAHRLVRPLARLTPRSILRRKLGTLSRYLALDQPGALYAFLQTHWKDPADVVLGASVPRTTFTDYRSWPEDLDFVEQMMYVDSLTYLPDDILVKVDRATMAVGLEGRVPLLDHRVVEFCWQLPLALRADHAQTKIILRHVLRRYVPQHLWDRPKAGFGVPIDHWLRGPLRDWAETLLDHRRLDQEGFFDARAVREKWEQHLSGRDNWQYLLWDVLMFQAWWSHLNSGG